jgi:hypothetical protein
MKKTRASLRRPLAGFTGLGLSLVLAIVLATPCEGRRTIRNAFFAFYPGAVGSNLDNLPTKADHCAVCHYDANGSGTKNPYGNLLKANNDIAKDWAIAISMADNPVPPEPAKVDPDGDGYSTHNELVGTGFSNTPTFPGLNASNVSSVTNAEISEIIPYVTPTTTVDTTKPAVNVLTPNGGEKLTGNLRTTVTWAASDPSGIVAVHIYLSLDGGLNYTPVVYGLANTGSYSWPPANRPTTSAKIKVVAIDGAVNTGFDVSDAVFEIKRPSGGKVPTTLRDFDMPGTQPFEGGGDAATPEDCGVCHGDYDPAVEPYANWQGSMMAHASIDPLFEANMVIANQDAPDSGDLCLRCHDSSGWMQGRSVPTDGSAMLEKDKIGVSCDLCHRMVDPVQTDLTPAEDASVLAGLSFRGSHYGNGMVVLDPQTRMRGPFDDTVAPHPVLVSSFHKSSAFCGTCHDVSNPAFTKDENGIYVPNQFDLTMGQVSPHSAGPVERTYSEWLNSEYATTGVHQPEFAGNKDVGTEKEGWVSTCQDCHMRDVNAKGCKLPEAPTRPDMPLHDMTGGSTWVPQMIANMYPDKVNAAAIQAGIERARYMLQNAADLAVTVGNSRLKATVTNQTGHKLPTGYPEGRRIWLNVKFYDAQNQIISESGAYNPATGVLSHDPEAKIYEVHPGIGENIAGVVGIPAGPSLHFVLNNKIFEDNRIPPRGFTNVAFAQFGGAPVGHTYADGQHWDDTEYTIPANAIRAAVRLYYQSTSKEFVEFLRDQNVTNNKGLIMYNLWNDNGKCPPELMAEAQWTMDPAADNDGDGIANSVEQQYEMNPFDSADALLDADDDGLSNLAESALASNPADAGSANHPEGLWVEVENPTDRHFALRYVRRVPNPNAAIIIETSDDLVNWHSGELQTATHEVIDHHDGTETVTERMIEPAAGVPAGFMRVKVVPASGP